LLLARQGGGVHCGIRAAVSAWRVQSYSASSRGIIAAAVRVPFTGWVHLMGDGISVGHEIALGGKAKDVERRAVGRCEHGAHRMSV